MKKKVVVALGHKALGTTFPEQKIAVKKSAAILADLVEEGCQLIISHSNAPQVGMIHTAMNEFGKLHDDYTNAPISVCSAMSQGYIGFDLQNALRAELLKRGIFNTVSTVLTQVLVDPYDEAFYNPIKVIGRSLTPQEAEIEEKNGNHVIEETPNHFRRIVASPRPKDIIEIDAIRALVDAGQIVIACGGGGIPVLEQGTELKGASAIIEKDLASGKLAELLDADTLIILTNEEFVCIDYKSEAPVALHKIDTAEAQAHIDHKEFGAAAMQPKIQASIDFVNSGANRTAVITCMEKSVDAFLGKTGTIITNK